MKFFSKTQILGVALATFVAFGISACDEVKSLAASVSIEQPLVTIEYSSQGRPYLSVQSQDNDTIIEDVIINRGNCAVLKYKGGWSKSYKEAHPDRCGWWSSGFGISTAYCKLRTQSGEWLDYEDIKEFLYSTATDMDYYNALDDESKATYEAIYPQKLSYGKKFEPTYSGCKTSDIIEVELVVNGGGRLTYSFK